MYIEIGLKVKSWNRHFCVQNNSDPKSFSEVMESQQSEQWKQAIDSKYKALMTNGTWPLEKIPDRRQFIGNKWIFKVKHNADGSINRYKARLVAQGFSQKPGIDYYEFCTYSSFYINPNNTCNC